MDGMVFLAIHVTGKSAGDPGKRRFESVQWDRQRFARVSDENDRERRIETDAVRFGDGHRRATGVEFLEGGDAALD